MARGRSSRRVFTRPPARSNVWLSLQVDLASVGTGSVATLISTFNAAALALRPFTIVRTRGVLTVVSDQAVASEFVQGVFSMQVVTAVAAAAGVASVPTPLTETDADYHVYQPFANSFIDATTVGFHEQSGQGMSWMIDSKSMRKVGVDDDCAMVVEGVGSNGFNVAVGGRMLIKLH